MNLLIEQGVRAYGVAPDQFGRVTNGRQLQIVISAPLLELGEPCSEQQLAIFEATRITSRVWTWLDFRPVVLCVVPDDERQVQRLGESVVRRYFQLQGITMDYPKNCFHSPIIQRIARSFDLPHDNLAKFSMKEVTERLKGESLQRCLAYAKEELRQRTQWEPDEWILHSEVYDRVKGRPLRMELPCLPQHRTMWEQHTKFKTQRANAQRAWRVWRAQASDQLSSDRSVLALHPEFQTLLDQTFRFPIVMQQTVREASIEPLLMFERQWRQALTSYLEVCSYRNENPSSEAGLVQVIDYLLSVFEQFGIYEQHR